MAGSPVGGGLVVPPPEPTVTVADEDDNERTLTLVGDDEADASAGKVGWNAPIARALRGAGDARSGFRATLVGRWAVVVPLAWLLGVGLAFGTIGVWWAFFAGVTVQAVWVAVRWWRGGWWRRWHRAASCCWRPTPPHSCSWAPAAPGSSRC